MHSKQSLCPLRALLASVSESHTSDCPAVRVVLVEAEFSPHIECLLSCLGSLKAEERRLGLREAAEPDFVRAWAPNDRNGCAIQALLRFRPALQLKRSCFVVDLPGAHPVTLGALAFLLRCAFLMFFSPSEAYCASAFVTFWSRRDAEIALRVQYRADGLQFVVSSAPAPDDVRHQDLESLSPDLKRLPEIEKISASGAY